jgi:hypothetical protein
MGRFPVHTIDSAPEASKSALGDVHARFGMIPNRAALVSQSHRAALVILATSSPSEQNMSNFRAGC